MVTRRSGSPSSPSEGEIVESGSDTKATTSQTSVNNDSHVDRKPRPDVLAPKSPSSSTRSYRHDERSRSRSPYHRSRGEKRRYDDPDYDRDSRDGRLRHANDRYDDRAYNRGDSHRHRYRSYHDHDRSNNYEQSLHYNDDYDRRPSKRSKRSRSRSHDLRRPRPSANDEKYGRDERTSYSKAANGRPQWKQERSLSKEQSVSERGNPSVIAQTWRHDAENRESQIQQKQTDGGVSISSSDGAKNDTSGIDLAEPVDEAALIEQRRKRREAIKAKYRDQKTPLVIQTLKAGRTANSPAPDSPRFEANGNITDSHQGSPAITPAETPGAQSPADFEVTRDEDLANTDLRDRSGLDREEPSAADYDPTSDMREDKKRHDKRHFGNDMSSASYDETKTGVPEIVVPERVEDQTTSWKAKDPFDMFAEDNDDMFAEEPPKSTDQAMQPSIAKPKELDVSMMDNWDDPEGYYNVVLGELINGRYHVQQILGKGMFSSVVRATDSKTGGLVAVKIVRNNDTMRKAGFKEIEILQQLRAADPDDKKHIIRFDRHFDHKNHLCMVFENLSMNLREVLKKFGRDVGINLRAIRAYAQQMFLGLNLLRKANILHADLKPDNLLVNENRNLLKICDLGSASPASESEITPYLVSRFYRAPEIILGIPYDYGLDIWSIGCTLFELYSGKILFTGRNNNQMLRSIMECRGKFSPKFLRRGSLTHLHFDDLLNFRSLEEDKITGRMVTKILDFKKPTRDLKSRLIGKGAKLNDAEAKEIMLFTDLLDRCLNLNPEKRCTPTEALRHPFITRAKS
ncbi:U4/U6 small nuclear ribonucleoprotein prp4 [Myotisia sp. PD_48]|nr:U4/U6 small nuclear ribonucleoprotein prp4 [Myotisia sp. PD_48]